MIFRERPYYRISNKKLYDEYCKRDNNTYCYFGIRKKNLRQSLSCRIVAGFNIQNPISGKNQDI
jgi:hypothetical protein